MSLSNAVISLLQAVENSASVPIDGNLCRDLIAENIRLREAQEWQDISTAPRDGTRILASDGHCVEVIYYADGWYNQSAEMSLWKAFPPIHWMPLRDPPVAVIAEDRATSATQGTKT